MSDMLSVQLSCTELNAAVFCARRTCVNLYQICTAFLFTILVQGSWALCSCSQ